MIYVVLNAVMATFLLWFAYYADKRVVTEDSELLISLNLELCMSCVFTALMIAASYKMPHPMMLFLARCTYVLFAFFCVDFGMYAAFYPAKKSNKAVSACRVIAAVFIILLVFRFFTDVNISMYLGLDVRAQAIFSGKLGRYLPYSWFDFYRAVFFYFIPALSALIMMLRMEASSNALNFQKSILAGCAVVASWIFLYAISLAQIRVALYSTLFPVAFVLMIAILVFAMSQTILYDGIFLLGQVLRFIVCFAIPSLLVGLVFPSLWRLVTDSPARFVLLMIVTVAVALTMSYQIEKLYNKILRFRSFQYADQLESELASFNYEGEPIDTVKAMESIFVHTIGVSHMRVLIDNGAGMLESVYNDPEHGRDRITLSAADKTFDSLLNQNKLIILKSIALETNMYFVDRASLLAIFNQTKCDAIILLTEGRRIVGAILLGSKSGGNVFTEYDNTVFMRLYSYFFVFGYYMKNIANQSVVGTVNREIHMSEQIITSIQQNMDLIKNPKVDVGYLMKHAHNIGGEFIDMIRLSADKHIFVLGDLSGKGISASMSMVIIKSIIRTYLEETKDFKRLIEKLNQFIRFNLPKGTFFEGIFGLLDFASNTMYYINCGVPAMFLYSRAFNNIIEIQGEGRVLGFVKDIGPLIKVKKTELNPGDIIVACTDGLIDSLSLRGEPFGKNRVQKAITENTMYPAEKMAQYTYDALMNFIAKGIDDDVSIFVLKVNN